MASAETVTVRRVLSAAALAEAVTGIVLAIDPALVTILLFGIPMPDAVPLGRVAGVALVALGLACWPASDAAASRTAAVRAMLAYNPLIAAYLVYLAVNGMAGVLLWPAVAEHAIVTLLLVLGGRGERGRDHAT